MKGAGCEREEREKEGRKKKERGGWRKKKKVCELEITQSLIWNIEIVIEFTMKGEKKKPERCVWSISEKTPDIVCVKKKKKKTLCL